MKPHYIGLKDSPSPKAEYVQEFGNLTGGLNLKDADYRLKASESPEMKNLLWRNGMLCSRKGQRWLSSIQLGTGYAAFEKLWHGYAFCHIGDSLYCFDVAGARGEVAAGARETTLSVAPGALSEQNNESTLRSLPQTGSVSGATGVNGLPGATQSRGVTEAAARQVAAARQTDEVDPTLLCSGIPEIRGTFFLYGNQLYYKTRGAYKVITATYTNGGWSFAAASVSAYVPVVLINANPTTGAGDLYQPENRLASRKTVWYNASVGVRLYHLPVLATTVTRVEVDGVRQTSGWAYDPQTGIVTFNTAPPVTDPPTNNTVRITYLLENAAAYQSIDDCRYCTVYGGTGELCVVMAGSAEQPNAYFWSGNSDIKMDASYFPIEQYQLASSTEERIAGFGKQQDNLIVFKEGSVGKTTLGTAVLNDRIYIDMPYVPINASIGCNLPWSIQLVENNLVFANSSGVYMLLDTTAANENNIFCISRKIDKAFTRGECLPGAQAGSANHDSASLSEQLNERQWLSGSEEEVCSCDDGKRYYLTGDGETYCWDYDISTYKEPSWFYLTNTNAVAYILGDELCHLDASGRLTILQESFNDYGLAIERVYRFPMSNFGSYDRRKNVNSVIVTLGAFWSENTELVYITDYEERADLTNLEVVPDYEASRVVGTRPLSDKVPAVFRRRPMCRRVLHFTMRLRNNNINEDLELIGAQVFYNQQGRLR